MDNHSYKKTDGVHVVWHARNPVYAFTVSRKNDRWVCTTPDGRPCWRRSRLGRPCQHVLLVWCELLRCKPPKFRLTDITVNFNKVYRRAEYTTLTHDSFKLVPRAPEPCSLTVNATTKTALARLMSSLEFMVAVTEDSANVSIRCLQQLVNR